MSLRTRLILAFAAVVLIPMALLAFGLRQQMARGLSQEYQLRVDRVIEVIREDLARESAGIAERLASLESALLNDNAFRLAAVAGVDSEREYLLDYAGTAMRLTGLSMLQIHDDAGRIISSGHFRNEHGRVESGLASALTNARGPAFVTTRSAEREFLALARVESFHLGSRTFTLAGGVAVDEAFLARLARDRAIVVSLIYPGGGLSTVRLPANPPVPGRGDARDDAAVAELQIPLIRAGAGTPIEVVQARLQVTQSLTPLRGLLRGADSWFLLTAAGTGLTALLLAVWVSSRLTGRLTALADKTAVLDLDRLDVDFDPGTDEVGTLSRLLGDLAARLRTSTARVREAERRATVGELARQINHDIKNGLIPIRNVVRHLAQVERDEPDALPVVFAERRQTLDSSIAYLETLATSYLRLSRPPERRDCDLNALITDVVRAANGHGHVEFATDLTMSLPRVVGDPVAIRRILENLTANAVDSLQSKPGRITVSTRVIDPDGGPPTVRATVADTGRGMTADEAGRIFTDFYTTKEGGTGLGLSIVRRLDGSQRHGRRRERTWHRNASHHRHSGWHSEAQMTMQVLVVDDVPAMAEQYVYDLKRVGGYNTTVAAGGDEALDLLAREPIDCVVLDLEMPGTDGFEVLRRLQQRGIDTPVIVYTGTGSFDRCVQAVRLGAYGFVDKAEPIERVVQEIENAVSRGRLLKELRSLQSRFNGEASIIGNSPPMRALRHAIARVAPIPSTVLIVGESGTGKELVARELHRQGPGEKTPLVAVNSAALPEQLVESELFGHERGAFTGADRLRRGAFENAGNGTLFLDEVGELPLPAQAKLLRVLEERKVMRVGGGRPISITARVVAATNRDLEREVEAGHFRRDFYYRLNVHTLRVPPLRERLSDLPALVDHLLRTIASQLGVRPKTIAPEAVTLLGAYDWRKNNVRELRNCLERMMIASDADIIVAADVPPSICGEAQDEAADVTAAPGTLKALKAQAERQIVLGALDRHDWHITRTAEALGLADHSSLLKIMRRHALSKGAQRDA